MALGAFTVQEGFWFYFRQTSDLMEWMGYDPALQYLQIRFVDGSSTTYSGITQNVSQSLMNASDPDVYYTSAIANYPTVSA